MAGVPPGPQQHPGLELVAELMGLTTPPKPRVIPWVAPACASFSLGSAGRRTRHFVTVPKETTGCSHTGSHSDCGLSQHLVLIRGNAVAVGPSCMFHCCLHSGLGVTLMS